MTDFFKAYCVQGKKIQLDTWPTSPDKSLDSKEKAQAFTQECLDEIRVLQYRLFVEQKQSLLVVLQAPDAAGKDGLIRNVLGQINAQGCSVHSFKVPSTDEAAHDFLWRIHAVTPAAGRIAVFNRSHYEDILVVRVKNLVPESTWRGRFAHINQFENLLADRGTKVLKFYLHISRQEQLKRFKARLEDPEKHWKLNVGDYEDRNLHRDYRVAYEDVFANCHSEAAPWFIVPADRKWFRDAVVASILRDALKSMNPQLPPVQVNLSEILALYEKELADSK